MTQQRLPQAHEYQHLGAYMRDLRLYYQLQLNDVASRLHIRAKYIQAIEDGTPELMPGKVYARGYIANYAEFLGLDGEAVAMEYLNEQTATKEQTYFLPDVKASKKQNTNFWLIWIMIAGVMCFIGALLLRPSHDAELTVEQVPEHLVRSIRTGLMPTSQNANCLAGAFGLACVQHAISLIPHYPLQVVESVPLQWKKAVPGKTAPSVIEPAKTQDAVPAQTSLEIAKESETKSSDVKQLEVKPDEQKNKLSSKPVAPDDAQNDAQDDSPVVGESSPATVENSHPQNDDEAVKLRDPNAPTEIEIPRRRR